MLESWTQALDNGYGLDVVYLDYRKAFYSVPHQPLLEKLKDFGIKKMAGRLPSVKKNNSRSLRSILATEWSATRQRDWTSPLPSVC